MNLIVQPEEGIAPTVSGIKSAKGTLDLAIFRFDHPPLEKALAAAVARGVMVRALIAHTNAGGDKGLRRLELRLLEKGVTVSRTANDLIRYHDKLMIVDCRTLYVLAFNFTRLDMDKSRSLGISTRDRGLVHEAIRLFEADITRQPYASAHDGLIVSPENARERLAKLLKRAQHQILIYDHKLSDPRMIKIIQEQARAGLDVRIIGRVAKKAVGLRAARLPRRRLHLRAMVIDGRRAFVGSQSLRTVELDRRREVGILIRDKTTIKRIQELFEEDWAETPVARQEAQAAAKLKALEAKRVEEAAGQVAAS